MKKLARVAAMICGASVLTVGLGGCTPTPTVTKVDDAQKLVDAMTFVKAKNGLCYGVATVERLSSNATLAVNQSIVPVECGKVGL